MDGKILTITHSDEGDHSLVVLNGEVDASTAKDLDNTLNDLTRQNPRNLVVDLAHVAYISSAGIGLFIYYSGELQKSGHRLAIAQPNETVREILSLLALEKFIPITYSLEEARTALVG